VLAATSPHHHSRGNLWHPHTQQYLSSVTIKPPALPTEGLGKVFGWFRVCMRTSDVWVLHSAGLDALVQQKVQALSVQLFLPMAILGCCMRECYTSQARLVPCSWSVRTVCELWRSIHGTPRQETRACMITLGLYVSHEGRTRAVTRKRRQEWRQGGAEPLEARPARQALAAGRALDCPTHPKLNYFALACPTHHKLNYFHSHAASNRRGV
jgi:hypothetical protein